MDDKLNNINPIDMEFSGYIDDDDTIFGSNNIDITNNNSSPVKTGIILDFNDGDDDLGISIKKNSSTKSVEFPKQATSFSVIDEYKGYNQIDMECKYYDDTEDDFILSEHVVMNKKSLFDNDLDENDINLDSKELIPEDLINNKPAKKLTVDELEDNFWKQVSTKFKSSNSDDSNIENKLIDEDKENSNSQDDLKNQLKNLQKKHAATIKKGAYGNSTFHFVGDGEKNRDMFNSGIGYHELSNPEQNSLEKAADSFIGASEGSISDANSAVSADGSASGSMGESLQQNYNDLLKEFFDSIGFKVQKDRDGTLLAKDLCNPSNIIRCNNISELIYELQPFIEACIITPLSIYTNQKFKSYKDWCDWYTDENKAKYPNYANEIKYCDLLANHLDECEV